MVQVTSNAVKAAALLMAVPALLLPMKAAAQQMAAATTPNFAACDQIKDPATSAQCYHDTKIRFYKGEVAAADARGAAADVRGVKADQRIRVAKNEGGCAQEVVDLRAAYPSATDIARGLVKASGRPAAEYNICSLRDGIRAGLALTK